MRLQFFAVPVYESRDTAEELNRFLASHRVVTVDREFLADGPRSVWAVCVTYHEGEGPAGPKAEDRTDYREVLSEGDFRVYSKLRARRKELAEKEGVPAYAILTNEQMAELVRRRVTTLSAIAEVKGVGAARVEKYGEAFLAILRNESTQADNEAKPGKP